MGASTDLEDNGMPAHALPTADWSREHCGTWEWQPSRQLLRALRDYQRAQARGDAVRAHAASVRHRFWSTVTGADLPLRCRVGGGLLMPHPTGIVVHPEAVIGENCLLFQQVTLGPGKLPGLPVLGHGVQIGAGARLFGGIRVGDWAVIGSNAVVLNDVPAGAVVAGVPAVVVRQTQGPSARR